MDYLRRWILAIVGTALVCGAAKALTPEGGVKKAVAVAGGFAMMAAMLGILGDVDALGISRYTAMYSGQAQEYIDSAGEGVRTQTRFIIEDRCRAYILDKADELGADVSQVSVTARWSEEGFWYPFKASLYGERNDELAAAMERELGILKENQTWSGEDEG